MVTMALSHVVSEIFNVENVIPWNRGQRSLKVIESGRVGKNRYRRWYFEYRKIPNTHN